MSPPPRVVLDDACAGRASVFDRPSRVFAAAGPDEVPAVLAAMQRSADSGHYLAGYFSYELGYVLEPRLKRLLPGRRGVPLLWFGQFDGPPLQLAGDAAQALWPDERVYATPLAYEWDRSTYRARFREAVEAIRAGETYEVNLSMRARFRLAGDPKALYGRLRRQSACAYGAFVDDGERRMLSLSPEMFFTVGGDGTIAMRPMKGTAARGTDPAADIALRDGLRTSPKNRAENLMIVDLIRNDLGRVADTGSVAVSELFQVETYPTVHQMTSTVRATLRRGTGIAEVLRALFPCGSVTGAPKIRTIEIIRALEDSPRGVYCGSVGVFAPDGSASFNVAIRTLTIADERGELGIGGAVVADSDADDEYDECLLKARFYDAARRPIALIETMPSRHGAWLRRRRHLHRMRESAAALGIPFDAAAADGVLDAAAASYADRDCRVRLLLHENGRLSATVAEAPPTTRPLRFVICGRRISSTDPLNRYKTDWRDRNEEALADARARGGDEAILVNERDEIVEGAYTNVFVERSGRLYTPPLASGALPGCLRAELLESGRCTEAVVTVRELAAASRVFLGNSLRGLVAAIPFGRPDTAAPAAPTRSRRV